MKILTWNINHRIREKKIPDRMVQAITSLNPHVIVLTEYVPGASRDGFKEKLSSSGMPYMFESAATPRQNHIFIASKSPLVPGEISAPAIHE
ncbi:MAG TPA: endonuclease/exonuclease/phosphatase family protein, partial [Deltaproteobacteria bacterium]|nr:endonuclease/exonuclease/phosphatase family protein [Deltaproteobacteria bacterium]